MRAKGDLPGGLRGGEASGGFEPLAMLVHEGDEGDWGSADLRGELYELVVLILWERVKEVEATESAEAILFVRFHGTQPGCLTEDLLTLSAEVFQVDTTKVNPSKPKPSWTKTRARGRWLAGWRPEGRLTVGLGEC